MPGPLLRPGEVRRRYATLTTQEAADQLGVTPSVVEALVRTGELATTPALGRNEAGRRFSEQGLDDHRSRLGTVTVRLADGTVVTGTVMPDAA